MKAASPMAPIFQLGKHKFSTASSKLGYTFDCWIWQASAISVVIDHGVFSLKVTNLSCVCGRISG